ncbi:MAG: nitronate monooxygenase [Acidimicrobiia bacterium]|nr:nitronate monooxygenase [Acidimicrobiia bacterium]
MSPPAPTAPLIIQGGLGVAVSGWRLARAVASAGQMGVVSGTAIDAVHARLLQDGDPGGHLRRAYEAFPIPGVAERVLERWLVAGGRPAGRRYRAHPMLTVEPERFHLELIVVSNFAEVWLAKDGHDGMVGINYLEKIQMATAPSAYGAMLAGVDTVLMGAGIPSAIPRVLRELAALQPTSLTLDVAGASPSTEHVTRFDPAVVGLPVHAPRRPRFFAIVSSASLAKFLARDVETRPDGFIIERPTAGGHNAPPRGKLQLDGVGQPIYGDRDDVDLAAVASLGLPFWLAGADSTPDGLGSAVASGAAGIQVGTAFAFCAESGITDELRTAVLDDVVEQAVTVRTDPRASPSGFPFKVVSVPGTVSEPEVYDERRRVCDLGYLRTPYERSDGTLGYRCPSEPVDAYVRKGGDIADTVGRKCLCNGLTATVGLGQVRRDGVEPALVTAGDAVRTIGTYLGADGSYTASDVIDHLLLAVSTGGGQSNSIEL